jgi:glycosyltransferase involved in cell wall biosynthesis
MAADATEVWVPSESAAVAIRVGSRAPVLPLPPLLSEISEITPSAERVGCSFVVHVDGRESFARQNPWASIAAFRAAFPRNERGRDARLVVVTRHLDGRSEGGKRLRYELDRVSGELLDVAESNEVREEISRGDVFVSLHRSEGFATHILDAMAIGRPVVATAFLGLVEYLDGTNGCPVGYSMREADAGDYYLDPCGPTRARRGECWAEANVDQAARWMRKMLSSPVLRRSLGARAALTVRELADADANLLERVRETTQRHLVLRERVRNEKVENRRRLDALYSSNGLVTAEPPLR